MNPDLTNNAEDQVPKNLEEQLAIFTEMLKKVEEEKELWKKEAESKKKNPQSSQRGSPNNQVKGILLFESADLILERLSVEACQKKVMDQLKAGELETGIAQAIPGRGGKTKICEERSWETS